MTASAEPSTRRRRNGPPVVPHLVLALSLAAVLPVAAQQPVASPSDTAAVAPELADSVADTTAWDGPRAVALLRHAIERRMEPVRGRNALKSYQADARGWLYFYLDRDNSEEMNLVRVDQIALEVNWASPGMTQQRIIGRRDEDRLPNTMRYHLDHLTVVQNDFGNTIRLGDGDEVRSVRHPAAPSALATYEYRLADSLTLYLPGTTDPVRVYELQVRPRNPALPGFIGSLFLDRQSSDIVSMRFTFTPASYVDRRLDYIRISLQNGLWEGKYWLPFEQRVEIRRKVPQFDFPVGAVIRGRYRITNYRFDVPLELARFTGPRVVSVPDSVLRAFPFEQGIYSDLEEEGLSPGGDLASLRAEARRLIGQRFLSGLPRLRFYASDASSILRYDRAEGLFLGGGVSWAAAPTLALRLGGGYATGEGRGSGFLGVERSAPTLTLGIRAYAHDLRDLGQTPGAAGGVSTLSSVFLGQDLLDPYFADGVQGAARLARKGWRVAASIRIEEQRNARLVTRSSLFGDTADVRPLRAIAQGRFVEGTLGIERAADIPVAGTATAALHLIIGGHGGESYFAPSLSLTSDRSFHRYVGAVHTEIEGSLALGEPPPQRLFLLGGSGTLPGYDYRSFIGDRYVRAGVELSRELVPPWVAGRLIGGVGWSTVDSAVVPQDWDASPTDGIRSYAGAGLSLLTDAVRLDLARGLNDGFWQLILSSHFVVW